MFVEHLIDVIVLLVHDNGPNNRRLADQFLTALEEDKKAAQATIEPELANFYISVIKTLATDHFDISDKTTISALLLRLKSDKALKQRREVYDNLKGIFENRDTMSAAQYKEYKDRVANTLLTHRMSRALRSGNINLSKSMEAATSADKSAYLSKVFSLTEELTSIFKEASIQSGGLSSMKVVNMNDPNAVTEALTRFEDKAVRGIWRFGQQGLNRALGKKGGVALGRFMNISALPHNFKSGLLLSILIWLIHYNEPPAFLPGPKVILLISLENETDENVQWLYRKMYYTEMGHLPPPDITKVELGIWVSEYLNRRGFHLRIHRYEPHEFGFQTLVQLVQAYESDGFSVAACVIDYLQMARKASSERASNASRDVIIQELFSNCRNFMSTKTITTFTAHPLNREAQKLVSLHTKIVQKFGDEHQADSMGVSREVDIQMYIHIEYNHMGVPYLTCKLTKHRYEDETPQAHKVFAMPLVEGLGLVDDLGKPATFVSNIYEANFNGEPSNDIATVTASSVF